MFGCGPQPSAAAESAESLWIPAKAGAKPPTIKAISFGKQPLGSSSTPVVRMLTNSTGKPLTISNITASGDFTENNGCVELAANASCSISIVFTPKHSGARSGKLTVTTNGPKVSAALSGTGVAPKVSSLSPTSQVAFGQLTLNGSGFAPNAPVLVSFTEKPKKGAKVLIPEAAAGNNGASIMVVVPPVIDPSNGQLEAGSATLSVQETAASGTLNSKSPPLKIKVPPTSSTLPPEQIVLAFLQGEVGFATTLESAVINTPLSGLAGPLGALVGALNGLISTLDQSTTGTSLATEGGVDVTVGQAQLTAVENQLLAMLNTLASGGGSASIVRGMRAGPGMEAQAASGGCLQSQAQQALNDDDNAAAFTNDITQLFDASLSSPACQQPGAAIATAGIVNGATGVALGIIAQAGTASVNPLVPGEAVLYADLGPAGQLISTGLVLAQTSDQASQAVEDSVETFNLGSAGQVGKVIAATAGALQTPYNATAMTAASFNQAVPAFDGGYSGNFSGMQFFSGGTSCSISGAIGLSVVGMTVTAYAPGAGSGTLSNNSGSFAIAGVGEAGVSCSFAGTFATDASGAAMVSGTWSCTAPAASSGFTSANGTWSASRQ